MVVTLSSNSCNIHTNSRFNSSRFTQAALNNYRFVIINKIPFLTRYEISGDSNGLLFESSQLRQSSKHHHEPPNVIDLDW